MDSDRTEGEAERLIRLTAELDDEASYQELFVRTRDELLAISARLMHRERDDHTLQPTALVHEAYLRLFRANPLPVENRAHFIGLAARAMRQILIEHARRRQSLKRGGQWRAVTISCDRLGARRDEVDVLEIDDALTKLAAVEPRAADVVEKRIFGGLTMEEIAVLMGLSRRTVQKDWRFAVLWLRREFETGTPPNES